MTYSCPNCNTPYRHADHSCAECGYVFGGTSCKYCGEKTEQNWEICPKCGRSLLADSCSFCGASMSESDTFCPECGEPRSGITCPQCQTLNFRNFCRKCNCPLNGMALEEVERAKADPKFQKALSLAQELAELEELILSYREEELTPPELEELSKENSALIEQYKELLSAFQTQEPAGTAAPPTVKPEAKPAIKQEQKARPKINLSATITSAQDAMTLYKQKLEEMQQALNDMMPDPGTTPQMQRDYYSARKVEIVTKRKIKIRVGWVCNAYNCEHAQPDECSKPWMGGKWLYRESEEITSTWENEKP